MQSGRDANGRYTQSLEGAERDREAVRLRTRGRSYQQISDDLGYGGWQNARRAVKATLAAVTREAAEEHITLQLERLDFMYEAALGVLETEHYTVSDGRLVFTGEDSQRRPLRDDSAVLKAIDRLLRIEERRARLLGLDQPARVEVASVSDLDRALVELEAELGARAAGVPVVQE